MVLGWFGSDTGNYKASENVGATDVYDGGAGIDTLQLELTRSEWLDPTLQSDLANYLQFLENNTDAATGQANNNAFVFNAFGLTASAWENLKVSVDGEDVDLDNQEITAKDDNFVSDEDVAISGNVLLDNGNGADQIPTNLLGVTLLAAPLGDVVLNSDGSFSYDPSTAYQYLAAGETAIDSFTYQIEDVDGGISTGTVSIQITGSNDAAVLSSAVVNLTETNVQITTSGVLAISDIDTGQAAFAPQTDTAGAYGSFSIAANGQWSFASDGPLNFLAADQVVTDVFNVTSLDGTATSVTVNITGTDEAPIAINDNFSMLEDNVLTLDSSQLLANDTGVTAGDATSILSVQNATKGSVSLNAGVVTFTPLSNYFGAASFSYTIQDSAGATSTAMVDVNIEPVSDTFVVPNLIKDGSFETQNLDPKWTVLGGGAFFVNGGGFGEAADGTASVVLANVGGLSQSFATVEGESYSVGFKLSQVPGTVSSTTRVSAGDSSQDFIFDQATTPSNMQWEQNVLSFTANSNSTVLSFEGLTFGAALDQVLVVPNQTINAFKTGLTDLGGDVVDLQSLLASIDAPQNNSAFDEGFLRFQSSGDNTLVQIDANGGGDEYVTTITLVGVALTPSDIDNYILGSGINQ